jgi:hypothetical protein
VREPSINDTTLGSLFIDDHWQCHTLEDVIRPRGEKVRNKTAIPPGRYKLILSMSNRFKKIMPEVINVPMFTGIRIHSGNTAKDTAGCLLVGQTRSVETRSIGRSRFAYTALMIKLTAAVKAGNTIYITFVNPLTAVVTTSSTFRLKDRYPPNLWDNRALINRGRA